MKRTNPPVAKAASSALRPPDKATPPIQRHTRLGAVMLEVFTPKAQRRHHQ